MKTSELIMFLIGFSGCVLFTTLCFFISSVAGIIILALFIMMVVCISIEARPKRDKHKKSA